jgi:crossover junction endodeoxyribonuclease RuvC
MIVGIDPGASGALAFFDMEKGTLEIVDMPVIEIERGGKLKREISPHFAAAAIRDFKPRVAWLEKVGAMPGQGVSSMFQFGRGVGLVEGVLAALDVPVNYVTPQAWQKAVGLRGGKDGSRLRAVELFPRYASLFARKKDDGRSDASLIAWYGATQ